MDVVFVLLGFLIGALVGMTGMGGGPIMTPAPILFGIPPIVAVGTDLFHGFLLTMIGGITHLWFGYVDYGIALLLIAGTILGAYIGVSLNSKMPSTPLRLILIVMLAGIVLLWGWLRSLSVI